jgi:hypothetical protein
MREDRGAFESDSCPEGCYETTGSNSCGVGGRGDGVGQCAGCASVGGVSRREGKCSQASVPGYHRWAYFYVLDGDAPALISGTAATCNRFVARPGSRLVELCKKGQFGQAINELYAPNVVSVEAVAMHGMPQRMEGIEAIKGKTKWWEDNHQVHGAEVIGPFPHGDRFVVLFKLDITPKTGPQAGKRMQMEEAGLYTVKDGKIVHEEFFYGQA